MHLAEVLQVVDGQIVAGQVQEGVDQHRAVAVGEHETVAIGPPGLAGLCNVKWRRQRTSAISAMPIRAPG